MASTSTNNIEYVSNSNVISGTNAEKIQQVQQNIINIKNNKVFISNQVTNPPKYIGLSESTIIDAISRDAEIEEICSKLFKNNMNRIVIYGIGGIGKTTLAVNVAKKLLSDKKLIHHIILLPSENKTNFEKYLLDATTFFGNNNPYTILLNAFNVMCEDIVSKHKQILLIYDNVDEFNIIKEYLPPIDIPNIKIIITSQYQTWEKYFFCYELKMFNDDMSEIFIKKKFDEHLPSDDIMKKMIESCGGYPLSLTLMISYVLDELTKPIKEPIDDIILDYLTNLHEKLGKGPLKYVADSYKLTAESAITINLKKAENECIIENYNEEIILKIKQILAGCDPDKLFLNEIIVGLKFDKRCIIGILSIFTRYSIVNFRKINKEYFIQDCPSFSEDIVTIHRITQKVLQNSLNVINCLHNLLKFDQSAYFYSILYAMNDQSIKKAIVEYSLDAWKNLWILLLNSYLDLYCVGDIIEKFIDVMENNMDEKIEKYSKMFCTLLYAKEDILFYIKFISKSRVTKTLFADGIKSTFMLEWEEPHNKSVKIIKYLKYICILPEMEECGHFLCSFKKYEEEFDYIWIEDKEHFMANKIFLLCLKNQQDKLNEYSNENLFSMLPNGFTILHFAAMCNNIQMLSRFETISNVNKENDWGETPLHFATLFGHTDVVKYLVGLKVKHNIDFNKKNWFGQTSFHCAVFSGCLGCINLLIENKVDINEKDNHGNSALFYAVARENTETIKTLVSNGINIDLKNSRGETALHFAARIGLTEIISTLIEQNININETDKNGNTALFHAVEYEHIETIKILINIGINIHLKNKLGRTVLHLAAEKDLSEIISLLIAHKININETDYEGETALFSAAKHGRIESIKTLINNGIDINLKNKQGETAVHIVAGYKQLEIVTLFIEQNKYINDILHDEVELIKAVIFSNTESIKTLLNQQTDINLKNNYEIIALHWAARLNLFEIVTLLIENNVNINGIDDYGRTALFPAVLYSNEETIKTLIHKGIDINLKNNEGKTVLHVAARVSPIDIISLLIEHNININETDNEGQTALFDAIIEPIDKNDLPKIYIVVKTIETLINNNIDINSRNKNGKTVLHFAARSSISDIICTLIENNININEIDNEGQTAIFDAIETDDIEIIEMLIDGEININLKNKRGKTALHFAVMKESPNIVNLLIENNIDINEIDDDGETALFYAVKSNSIKIVRKLINHDLDVNAKNFKGETCLEIAERLGYSEILDVLKKNSDTHVEEDPRSLNTKKCRIS